MRRPGPGLRARSTPILLALLTLLTASGATLALGVGGCGGGGAHRRADRAPGVRARRVFTHALRSPDEFAAYSKEVAGERYTKFILDVRTGDVTFFDVNVYPLHVDFVFREIYRRPMTNDGLALFNRNYEAHKPEFLLGYLVHYLEPDVWTLSFWEGDEVTPAQVRRAIVALKRTFYDGAKVRFRPDSTSQEEVARHVGDIPVITNDTLYRSVRYHAFTTGEAVGKLRIVRRGAPLGSVTFAPDEVVILPESVPDITPVRGIISERFSTPLAHVALRARAWGIPHVGYKDASRQFAALDGQWVWLKATRAGLTLRLSTQAERDADAKARAHAKRVTLPAPDLSQGALKPLSALRATDAGVYGAKAANLGEIVHAHPPGVRVPPGFAIPVRYYAEHMRRHHLDARVEVLLADSRFRQDRAYRKAALVELRQAIRQAPLAPSFQSLLAERLTTLPSRAGRGVFVRSSTNCEDLPGFSGAGLYDTVPNVMGPMAVADAVRAVWASVWNLRAYEEREHYGIDHRQVYGAALVQVGVNATAAGVLVTANIFDPLSADVYTINAKSGLGIRVVQGRRVPEQVLFDYSNLGVKVLSRSDEDTKLVFDPHGGVREVPNGQKGRPILTDTRALELVRAARAVEGVFPKAGPLDIEWLYENTTLYIVQARPAVGIGRPAGRR